MMHNRKLQVRLAAAIAACYGGATLAASPPPASQEARLATLEQRLAESQQSVAELAAEVHALQAQLARQAAAAPAPAAATAAASAAAAAEAERLAAVERDVAQITAASSTQRNDSAGLPLHGFADVDVGNHHPITADNKGASVASLDFYLAPQLGPNTRALFELNFEVAEDGSVGVDLERAQIGYQMGNSGTLWAGRFHTPYGYYNTAFHHGQQIATSLRRPRFLAFEDQGGILPAHTVGLWFTGSQHAGDGHVGYDFYVGNSQHVVDGSLNQESAGTPDGQVMGGGKLYYSAGGSLEGLQFGVSALTARITDEAAAANLTRLGALGLHVAYDSDQWENMAEYYFFSNQSLAGGGTHSSNAGFVQFGWRNGTWTPYARYERAQLDQADGYFAAQANGGSYHREALGLRYDLDIKSALKLELADTHFTDRIVQSYGDVLMQYAIRF